MTGRVMNGSTEIRLETGVATLVSMIGEYLSAAAERRAEKVRRNKLAGLLEHSDWELRDMGISRDDVYAAINLPLDASAGHHLELVRRRTSKEG